MEGHANATERYELIRQIAEGGFGQVFLARMKGAAGFHRTVAIKRIRLNQAASPEQIDDFIREARIGGYLHHHNVVQVLGFEELDGGYSLIMEYVDGVGLNQVADMAYARGLDLPISMVAELIAQAADGLQYIHTLRTSEGQPLKLIHRDLKPSNLLISRSGLVKITDFGIARTALGIGKGTQAGIIKGTLGYLSPEQARGEVLDHRSDLYSLGAILYELLMLEPLHFNEAPLVLLRQLACNQVDVQLARLAGTRGAVFMPILRRLLASFPDDRYASAAEVAEAVRGIQQLHAVAGVHLANQAAQWIDAVGTAPTPGQPNELETRNFVPDEWQASGSDLPRGAGAGSSEVGGRASGSDLPRGAGAGSSEVVGRASGSDLPRGAAAGSSEVVSRASGSDLPRGAAAGSSEVVGRVSGSASARVSEAAGGMENGTAGGKASGSACGKALSQRFDDEGFPIQGQSSGARAVPLPPPVALEDGEWALDRDLADDLGEAPGHPEPRAPLSATSPQVARRGSNALTRLLQPMKLGRLASTPVFGMATQRRAASRKLNSRVGAALVALLALGGWVADGCPMPQLLADQEEVLTMTPSDAALVPASQRQSGPQSDGQAAAGATRDQDRETGLLPDDTDYPQATLATHLSTEARGNDLNAQNGIDVRQGFGQSKGMGAQR